MKKARIKKSVILRLINEEILAKEKLAQMVGGTKSVKSPEEIAANNVANGNLESEVNQDFTGMEGVDDDILNPEELLVVMDKIEEIQSILSQTAVKHTNEGIKDKLFKLYDEFNKLKTKIMKENDISH